MPTESYQAIFLEKNTSSTRMVTNSTIPTQDPTTLPTTTNVTTTASNTTVTDNVTTTTPDVEYMSKGEKAAIGSCVTVAVIAVIAVILLIIYRRRRSPRRKKESEILKTISGPTRQTSDTHATQLYSNVNSTTVTDSGDIYMNGPNQEKLYENVDTTNYPKRAIVPKGWNPDSKPKNKTNKKPVKKDRIQKGHQAPQKVSSPQKTLSRDDPYYITVLPDENVSPSSSHKGSHIPQHRESTVSRNYYNVPETNAYTNVSTKLHKS